MTALRTFLTSDAPPVPSAIALALFIALILVFA